LIRAVFENEPHTAFHSPTLRSRLRLADYPPTSPPN
jgi:hypothetical protein